MNYKSNQFRRGLPRRLSAMILAVCMVFTMSPSITEAEASYKDRGEPVMLSGFVELPENIRRQSVPLGTALDEMNLPDTLEATEQTDGAPPTQSDELVSKSEIIPESNVPLTASPSDAEDATASDAEEDKNVTISGVTWEGDPLYDAHTSGTYRFTAVLPSGYAVEDGIAMPEITVTVEKGAVDKVIAMIDALPALEEWLAMDEITARAVMDKILAAKKAYDALADEDKALIDETRTGKLTELAQMAQQLVGAVKTLMDIASGESNTCSWRIDEDGLLTIWPTNNVSGELGSNSSSAYIPWESNLADVKKVLVQSGVNTDYYAIGLFSKLANCTEINLSGLNTTKAETLRNLFFGCTSLTSLTFGNDFNTAKVKDMSGMLDSCTELTILDISGFDTQSVTNAGNMFNGMTSLTSVTLGDSFSTGTVTAIGGMFAGCSSLTALDLSKFNTSNVTNMKAMFQNCSKLTSLDLSSFTNPKATSMLSLFEGCTSLETIEFGTKFSTAAVTDMESMFENCSALKSLDVSSFNTSKVKYMLGMFEGCSELTAIDLSTFDTSVVTDMDKMFSGCLALSALDLSNFSTAKLQYTSSMFDNCTLGLKTEFFKTDMKGKKIYLYDKDSKNNLANTNLKGDEGNIVYRPYAITKTETTNGSFTVSSDGEAENYFTKTELFYASNAPDYDSTKSYAQLGKTVTITPTPDIGYVLDTLSVTKGGTTITTTPSGSSYTFTMPADEVTVTTSFKQGEYEATITVNKDNAPWSDSGKKFKLSKDDGASFITNLTKVLNGTYTIYEMDGTSTGVSVTINNAEASAAVDYYTVTFYDGATAYSTPASQVVLKTNGRVTAPADPAKAGYTFAGWKTTNGGGVAFDFTDEAITTTTGVYASWRAISVTGISLDKTGITLVTGETETLTDTVLPDNAANKSVTWTSDNTGVATVANGVVTAVNVGTATITVTTADGSKTASCIVTVNPNDAQIVAAAKEAAEKATYAATTQAATGTEEAAKAYAANIATTAVNNSSVTVTVDQVSYTTPVAGTSSNREGTNGSDTFTVTVSKGTQSQTTIQLTIIITATAYSGSSSDDDDGTTTSSASKPVEPVTGSTENKAAVDDKGNANVTITNKNIADTIANAMTEANKKGVNPGEITAVINVTTEGKDAAAVSVKLPKVVQDQIIGNKIAKVEFVIDRPDLTIGMNLAAVTEINRQANGDVQVSAGKTNATALSAEAKTAIGNRPAYDLRATWQNGGKSVQNFGMGTVSIEIPYKLQSGETAGNIYAVHVDGNGKVTYLPNSGYDVNRETLVFSTNHFSVYGVGFQANTPKLTDITNHWAKDEIEFAVSRGLISGTGNTSFSPDSAMTRGMFVTALGRLAGVDVSSYKTSSFGDVKADSYYKGYIEWSRKNNILAGIGGGNFAPDSPVTREQMAVAMERYATVTGFKLPEVYEAHIFADYGKISTWAWDAIKRVRMAGIITGKTGNKFDPQGAATRAEVSAVLKRFVELTAFSDTAQGWKRNDSGKWMYYENGKAVASQKTIGGMVYQFDSYGEMKQ